MSVVAWFAANDPAGYGACDSGITATWCTRCGARTCPPDPLDDLHLSADGCPLHDAASDHGDHLTAAAEAHP